MRPFFQTGGTRTDLDCLLRRFKAGRDPAGARVNSSPRHTAEWDGAYKLTGFAIQDEEVSVFVEVGQELFRPAIKKDIFIHAIVIPHVVRCPLVVPFDGSTVGIHSDDGACIKVGTASLLSIEVRARISDTPIQQVQIGIIGPGNPSGPAATFPSRGPFPSVATRLARFGYRVKPPRPAACIDSKCIDVAANTIFAAAASENDRVHDDERCHSCAFTRPDVTERDVPRFLPRPGVERDGMTGRCGEKYFSGGHCDSAIDVPAAQRRIDGYRVLILPQHRTFRGIKCPDLPIPS